MGSSPETHSSGSFSVLDAGSGWIFGFSSLAGLLFTGMGAFSFLTCSHLTRGRTGSSVFCCGATQLPARKSIDPSATASSGSSGGVMLNPSSARERMVEAQIARRGIRDRHVLEAMRRVPREAFVEPGFDEFAYEDSPLPIGEEQTISQPYIVAAMIEAAEVKPGERVLEVGTGSGYAAAVLSQIAGQVYGIERHKSLAEAARRRLTDLGYENVEIRVGDGTLGWPEAAPFDAIL